MYSSLSCSLSGERSDRSRFYISHSEANFRPAPSDLAIDQALEDFAALGLQDSARPSRRSNPGEKQNTSYRPTNLHPQPPPYAISYTGSNAAASTASYQQPLRMIDYPGSGSVVSTHSRRTRPDPIDHYQYAQPNGSRYQVGPQALTRFSGQSRRSGDMLGEICPEDSISQVSMSSRRSDLRCAGSERRGRSRRRDEERSTVVGRSDGRRAGPFEGEDYGDQGCGVAPAYYETREVTPWD